MILYIIEAIVLLIFTTFLVWYFSHETTPIYVRLLVTLSFTLSFGCFIILPMDIYETSIGSDLGKNTKLLWLIVYDINALLCWAILPIVQ